MDEVWERAVEAALEGSGEAAAPRSLTLDGAVKCIHGRLPPPSLLERFQSLEHLSITNVGVASLEMFPRLPNLQRLSLSDNRIAGGLEFLVEAGLDSLRDLDLSNNRIAAVEDLAPLARLRLVSLDLYECPVTRGKDYRLRVFGMIRSLKYLDKMDADENERPESDDEEEEDEEEDDDDEDEDPGVGEIDGQEHRAISNGTAGNNSSGGAALDVDEDEESDADEETDGIDQVGVSGSDHLPNGYRVVTTRQRDAEEDEEEEVEYEDDSDDDLGEEIDEEVDDDVVEVQEVDDSDEDEGDGDDDEGDEDVEDEVDDEEDEELEDDAEPVSTRRFASSEGEIDGHEQGEDDENGEIGEEEEQGIDDDQEFEDEEDDGGSEFLMQPVPRRPTSRGDDFGACSENEGDGEEDGVEDEAKEFGVNGRIGDAVGLPSSQSSKRRREHDGVLDDDENTDSQKTSKSKHMP